MQLYYTLFILRKTQLKRNQSLITQQLPSMFFVFTFNDAFLFATAGVNSNVMISRHNIQSSLVTRKISSSEVSPIKTRRKPSCLKLKNNPRAYLRICCSDTRS